MDSSMEETVAFHCATPEYRRFLHRLGALERAHPDERLDKAAAAIAELQARVERARRELSELDSLECEQLHCCAEDAKRRGFWARLGASVHQVPGRGKSRKLRDVAEVEHRRSLKLMEIFELGEELRRQEMEMQHWEKRAEELDSRRSTLERLSLRCLDEAMPAASELEAEGMAADKEMASAAQHLTKALGVLIVAAERLQDLGLVRDVRADASSGTLDLVPFESLPPRQHGSSEVVREVNADISCAACAVEAVRSDVSALPFVNGDLLEWARHGLLRGLWRSGGHRIEASDLAIRVGGLAQLAREIAAAARWCQGKALGDE